MTESTFDSDLAQAAIDLLDEREYGHPSVHPLPLSRLVTEILPPLGKFHSNRIPGDVFGSEVRKVAEEALLGEKGADELKTLLRAYRIVRPVDDAYSILNAADLPAPWLGLDRISAPHLNQRQRYHWFAHLHMLAYPELLDVVELLAPPGRTSAEVERAMCNRFAFTRKINATIAAYLVNVAQAYEIASKHDQVLRNAWAPPALLGALVMRCYLALTGYSCDRGVESGDLMRQCTAVFPGTFFPNNFSQAEWFRALRTPPDTFRWEVGGAQFRVREEGVLWFARSGLLSAVECGFVLRARGATASLARVRARLAERMNGFKPPPINANEILAELVLA